MPVMNEVDYEILGSRLASRIYAAAPQTGGRRHEEGSILGTLGDMLDGDGR